MIVGIKSGSFSLMHAGHIWMLDFCKQRCDYLITLCNDDRYILHKKGIVVVPLEDRMAMLRAIRVVDEVSSFPGFTEEFWIKEFIRTRLRARKPDGSYEFGNPVKLIVFHSEEIRNRAYIPAKDVADEIIFVPRIEGSTTEIFNKIRGIQ